MKIPPDTKHRLYFTVDDGYLSVMVRCEWPKDDRNRPCWPHDEDGGLARDSEVCNYAEWLENTDITDLVHGRLHLLVEWGYWDIDFAYDYCQLNIGDPPGEPRLHQSEPKETA